jgi:hypothetical protein
VLVNNDYPKDSKDKTTGEIIRVKSNKNHRGIISLRIEIIKSRQRRKICGKENREMALQNKNPNRNKNIKTLWTNSKKICSRILTIITRRLERKYKNNHQRVL